MIVLLPEGRAVCNPDSIKMVKVVHSEVQGKRTFVVIVKLDDDAELMIKTLSSVEEAYALADQCSDLINSAEGGDDFSEEDEEDSDEDDDSFSIGLSASVEQSVKGTPSANESDWDSEPALAPAAPETGADSIAQSTTVLESSDWDVSSEVEESSSWLFTSEEDVDVPAAEVETPIASVEEESSDWGTVSEEIVQEKSPPPNTGSTSSGSGSSNSQAQSAGAGASQTSVAEVAEESSDWSLSVEVQEDDDESSDWFSDDGFSAPVRSPVAKERAMKKNPKPVEKKVPVVEVLRPTEPTVHDDSLDDSDDWFVDDGNDDWY